MKKTRIYFFIRTFWDLLPAIWVATRNKNFDVGVFYCNDKESWNKYLQLKNKISQIIDPNYPSQKFTKGKIEVNLHD